MPLPTAERPPDLGILVNGLERLVRDGLPATEEMADTTLLSLRGVTLRGNSTRTARTTSSEARAGRSRRSPEPVPPFP
jgi:hypothetical protein